MDTFKSRIQSAFQNSRKLSKFQPNQDQLNNVVFRLLQIYSREELEQMDDKKFTSQVERVWPIAQYVDQKPSHGSTG